MAKNHRPLNEIAAEIQKDWGNKMSGVAKPYVDAMATLDDMGTNMIDFEMARGYAPPVGIAPLDFVPYLPAPVDRAAWHENRERMAHNNRTFLAIGTAAHLLRAQEWVRLRALIIDLPELRALPWQRFEDQIALLFRRLGYQVQQTPYSGDGGRDAIMTKDGQTYLLECKRYGHKGTSGRPDLQKFHSAIISAKAVSGFFVTSGFFSKEAKRFAGDGLIELIDADALALLMFKNKTAADNDSYRTKCCDCGLDVTHRLRAPAPATCSNGHKIEPSLSLDVVFAKTDFAVKYNRRCGSPLQTPPHVTAPCPPHEWAKKVERVLAMNTYDLIPVTWVPYAKRVDRALDYFNHPTKLFRKITKDGQ